VAISAAAILHQDRPDASYCAATPLQVLDAVAELTRAASPSPSLPGPPTTGSTEHEAGPSASRALPVAQGTKTKAGSLGASQQAALLQYLHDQLLRSDDYVRKGLLARWFFGLVGSLRQNGLEISQAARKEIGEGVESLQVDIT
jgi:hypothetical protein